MPVTTKLKIKKKEMSVERINYLESIGFVCKIIVLDLVDTRKEE